MSPQLAGANPEAIPSATQDSPIHNHMHGPILEAGPPPVNVNQSNDESRNPAQQLADLYFKPKPFESKQIYETIGWPEGEALANWYNPSPPEATKRWRTLTTAAFAPIPRLGNEASRPSC